MAAFYLLRAAYTTEGRAWLRQGVMAGVATFAFVLPWCVLAFINTRTAFYPVMAGNVHKAFGDVGVVPFVDEIKWALRLLFQYKPVASISLLFLAAVMLPFARRARALHAFLLATAFGFVLMMHYFRSFADVDSILRYMFAFTLAFCLAAVLRTFREGARPGRAHAALAATAMAAVAVGGQSSSPGKRCWSSTVSASTPPRCCSTSAAPLPRRIPSMTSIAGFRTACRRASPCW